MPKLGLPYPRAAVATVLANPNRGYLLVKRGNPPGKGKWSLPGGKLELGEETLQGAIREVQEETSLPPEALCFHPNPICSTDAIIYEGNDDKEDGENYDQNIKSLQYHYVISQCFAWVSDEWTDCIFAQDDVLDARWFSLDEIEEEAPGSQMATVIKLSRDLNKANMLAGFPSASYYSKSSR